MDPEIAQESANQIKGIAFTQQWWQAEVHRQVRMDPSVLV
jgi:hypothetical protein